ncbi:MAG: YqgE/AlgH family protein [Alphaproteobacteria bacterium]|nr:YqgE/AlgH family protein [Alphaproteobacteria bacterium]
MNVEDTSLIGQFLIAVPGIDDVRFNRSVIYVFAHSPTEGAKGLVINKPAEKLFLRDILAQLNLAGRDSDFAPLLLGGPDKITSGFILHSTDYQTLSTHAVTDDIALTATQDILHDIAVGKGPSEYLMTLGCATWQRGQLEDELVGNVWVTAPATHQILFHTPYEERWNLALKNIGVDSFRLSATVGKA